MQFTGPRPAHELTYSDVFLVPNRSEVPSRLDVDLTVDDATGMRIPVVSANMNAVTGPRLAASMARRGGLGVLPQDLGTEEAAEAIRSIKAQSPVWGTPFEAAADETVARVLERVYPAEGFGVLVREGERELGLAHLPQLRRMPPDARMGDILHEEVPALQADELGDARGAFDALHAAGAQFAAVMRAGRVIGTVSLMGALRGSITAPALDANGCLLTAAAIGVSGAVAERARALAEAGADVLVIDTAHGHQARTLRAIETVRGLGLGLPIVAGNVVTAAGVRDLVRAGASIVKVGVGPGAMCTTRMMTAVGRPQFSAVLEAAEQARSLGAGTWADGGVRHPRDVALALAAGASAVMVGSWFAGTLEAPGVVRADGERGFFKESFGMASSRAVEARFASLAPYERARRSLFAEGISSSRIRIDPQRPSVEDLLDAITTGVRSSCAYAGATTLAEFHARALLGVQSAAGYEEGKALPASW